MPALWAPTVPSVLVPIQERLVETLLMMGPLESLHSSGVLPLPFRTSNGDSLREEGHLGWTEGMVVTAIPQV